MAEDNRPEVNLEVCSGFFRIPTNDIIYNIKVLASNESSTTRVIEKIVEVEKQVAPVAPVPQPASAPPPPAATPHEALPPEPPPQASPPASPADDYYQQAASKFYAVLSKCGKPDQQNSISGSATVVNDGLNDLASMAEELGVVLKVAKAAAGGGKGGGNNMSEALKTIAAQIAQAQNMLGSQAGTAAPEPAAKEEDAPEPAAQKATRYLFNFDAVFQTIYELCTNETVKEHVQKARAKAEEIFSKDSFYDNLSPKVAELQEDDGFFTIPMSDIFQSLGGACSDKATKNLLKKMDQQQGDIFLDQFLPLEVPPTEEVVIPVAGKGKDKAPAATDETPASVPDGGELAAILDRIAAAINVMGKSDKSADDSSPTDNQEGLADNIDNAINIAASINYDARQIADISTVANQITWLPVQTEIVFMESLLAQKNDDSTLSFADGEVKARTAANDFLTGETTRLEELMAPPEDEPDDDDDDGGGDVGQDEIDRLLEEMG